MSPIAKQGATRWADAVVLLLLPVQAVLLFSRAGMLTLWTDELSTLLDVSQPLPGLFQSALTDMHPPLYFLLVHFWIRLPLPGDTLDRVRMFSAVWTLIATIALDRLWLASWTAARRLAVLLLWCFSPLLLLYGRMARSYSMQAALSLIAIALAWRLLRQPDTRRMLASALAVVALLYTHFVPGLAIAIAFGIALLLKIDKRLAVAWSGLIAVAYLPWVVQMGVALRRWTTAPGVAGRYELTGGFATEHLLKIGYALVAFQIGESFPVWALIAVPVVSIAAFLSLLQVWPRARELAPAMLGAALIGYIGVSRWVSYPFTPARLLWLLPFFFMAVALARYWLPLTALLLILNAVSIWCYFHQENFRNKGYVVPLRAIASEASHGSLVLVDRYNTDCAVLLRDLQPVVPTIVVDSSSQAAARAALRDDRRARDVWFIRNSHDISPGHLVSEIETLACAGKVRREQGYVAYEPWERQAMRLMGISDPPRWFYEVSECSTSGTPRLR